VRLASADGFQPPRCRAGDHPKASEEQDQTAGNNKALSRRTQPLGKITLPHPLRKPKSPARPAAVTKAGRTDKQKHDETQRAPAVRDITAVGMKQQRRADINVARRPPKIVSARPAALPTPGQVAYAPKIHVSVRRLEA